MGSHCIMSSCLVRGFFFSFASSSFSAVGLFWQLKDVPQMVEGFLESIVILWSSPNFILEFFTVGPEGAAPFRIAGKEAVQADILLASEVGPGNSREMLEASWLLSLPLSVLQLSSVLLAVLGIFGQHRQHFCLGRTRSGFFRNWSGGLCLDEVQREIYLLLWLYY